MSLNLTGASKWQQWSITKNGRKAPAFRHGDIRPCPGQVSDLGMHSFLRAVEHYCLQEGSELAFVDRFFPSSKMCSSCGHINNELALKNRSWVYSECRTGHDRDKNAAIIYTEKGHLLLD